MKDLVFIFRLYESLNNGIVHYRWPVRIEGIFVIYSEMVRCATCNPLKVCEQTTS